MAKKKTRKSPQRKTNRKSAKGAAAPTLENFPHDRGQESQYEDYQPERRFGDEDYDYEAPHRHSGRYQPPPPRYYNSPSRSYHGPFPKRASRSRFNSRKEIHR